MFKKLTEVKCLPQGYTVAGCPALSIRFNPSHPLLSCSYLPLPPPTVERQHVLTVNCFGLSLGGNRIGFREGRRGSEGRWDCQNVPGHTGLERKSLGFSVRGSLVLLFEDTGWVSGKRYCWVSFASSAQPGTFLGFDFLEPRFLTLLLSSLPPLFLPPLPSFPLFTSQSSFALLLL